MYVFIYNNCYNNNAMTNVNTLAMNCESFCVIKIETGVLAEGRGVGFISAGAACFMRLHYRQYTRL